MPFDGSGSHQAWAKLFPSSIPSRRESRRHPYVPDGITHRALSILAGSDVAEPMKGAGMTAVDRPTPIAQMTVAEYIEAVADGTPAPGGGSVCAVVGALAAALGSMVARLTAKRRGADADALTGAIVLLDQARLALVQLASDDQAANSQYIIATRLPRSTDEEKAIRKSAQQDALLVSTDVPLAVAQRCLEVVGALQTVAHYGQKTILPDASVGAWMAVAAGKGALLNIRSNTSLMTDRRRAEAYHAQAAEIERRLSAEAERVHATVEQRL
jgi:glutamate formiminotransferase/formiminotetrahydrofolate cyclodeaminase